MPSSRRSPIFLPQALEDVDEEQAGRRVAAELGDDRDARFGPRFLGTVRRDAGRLDAGRGVQPPQPLREGVERVAQSRAQAWACCPLERARVPPDLLPLQVDGEVLEALKDRARTAPARPWPAARAAGRATRP